MSAATKNELNTLHAELAQTFAEAIKEQEVKVISLPDGLDEAGEVKMVPTIVKVRNAAILNAARQFLKDNGIECAPGNPSQPVKDLAEVVKKLPFTPDDSEEQALH